MRIAQPGAWLLIIGLGYVNGIVLYFFVKLDSNTKNRKLDIHNTIYLISLPSWIGVSQRFRPEYWPLRLYYFSTLLFGMAVFAVGLCSFIEYAQTRLRKYQVHTVAEVVIMEYRLAGTAAISEHLQNQQIVSDFLRMNV